jgi:hypothetical protein
MRGNRKRETLDLACSEQTRTNSEQTPNEFEQTANTLSLSSLSLDLDLNKDKNSEESAPVVSPSVVENLAADYGAREAAYWAQCAKEYSRTSPTQWKRLSRDSEAALRSWRRRKLEDGYSWDESTGTYTKTLKIIHETKPKGAARWDDLMEETA